MTASIAVAPPSPPEPTPAAPTWHVAPDRGLVIPIPGLSAHPVVVAVDDTELSHRAARVAARLAYARAATLVLVSAVPGTARHGMFSYILDDRARWVAEARAELRELADTLVGALPGLRVEIATADGPPAPALLAAMQRASASLAVVATRGRAHLARALGGSVANDIARGLDAPTLILWPKVADRLASNNEDGGDAPIGRRVILPIADAVKHPRLVAEAFRAARVADGDVAILVGPDATLRGAANRLATAAVTAGIDAHVVVMGSADWVSIAGAVTQELGDLLAMPTIADLPGTRPGIARIHRDIVTRCHVPLLCVPDLPNGESHGLAALYPDVPLSLLDAARHLLPR